MKKTLAKILALALCAVLLVTGTVFVTLAYLQDHTNVVKNTFSSSGVTLRLNETKVNTAGKPIDDEGKEILDDEGNLLAGKTPIREGIEANKYELVPGSTYLKDPKVFVEEGSVPCYVYIAILDTMFQSGNDAETEYDAAGNPITFEETLLDGDTSDGQKGLLSAQLAANGWVKMSGQPIMNPEVIAVLGNSGASWTDNNGNALYTLYKYQPSGKSAVVDAKNAEVTLDIFDEFTILESATELNANDKHLQIIAFGVQSLNFIDAETAWASTYGSEGGSMDNS